MSSSLTAYISDFLEPYSPDFKTFFLNHCESALDFFSQAKPEQPIYEYLFDEGNIHSLPYKAKQLINNIEGLSHIKGFSFMRQIKLANKLEISDRWLRKIASKLKNIGLLFSARTKAIHYRITFNLDLSVVKYIKYLISAIFYYYSGSSSRSSSEPSSGSQTKFSLANALYHYSCRKTNLSEDKEPKREKISIRNEEAAMPPSPTPIAKVEKKEEPAKGSFSLEQYLSFAEAEAKKKNIYSPTGLAEYLMKTGAQDRGVGKFLAKILNRVSPEQARGMEVKKAESTPVPKAASLEQLEQFGREIFSIGLTSEQQLKLLRSMAAKNNISSDLSLEELKKLILPKLAPQLAKMELEGNLEKLKQTLN